MAQIQKQISECLIAASQPADLRFMGSVPKPQGVAEWSASLGSDGAWSPLQHLSRVTEMAKAYANPVSKFDAASALLTTIQSALRYWNAKDFRSPNGFQNEIRVPQYLAQTLLLMELTIAPDDREASLKIIARSTVKMTGQNRV